MTELRSFYDHLRMAQLVQIRDDERFVEMYWTDEMQRQLRAKDVREAKRMFLTALCILWEQKTGEKLRPKDWGPGTEWTLEEVNDAEGTESERGRHDGERSGVSQHEDEGRVATDTPPGSGEEAW